MVLRSQLFWLDMKNHWKNHWNMEENQKNYEKQKFDKDPVFGNQCWVKQYLSIKKSQNLKIIRIMVITVKQRIISIIIIVE